MLWCKTQLSDSIPQTTTLFSCCLDIRVLSQPLVSHKRNCLTFGRDAQGFYLSACKPTLSDTLTDDVVQLHFQRDVNDLHKEGQSSQPVCYKSFPQPKKIGFVTDIMYLNSTKVTETYQVKMCRGNFNMTDRQYLTTLG